MIFSDSDRPLWQQLLWRSGAATVATVVCVWLGVFWLGNPFSIVGALVLSCMAWAVAVAVPVIERLADRAAGSVYQPGDANFRVRPQFSVAEAHVQAGRYAEAIAQFRRDCEQFPTEAKPHVRIADLQLEHLDDPAAAIAELQAALGKAQGADAVALIGNRLADLLLAHRHDHAAAMECYREIQHRCPGTRHAQHAATRATALLAR